MKKASGEKKRRMTHLFFDFAPGRTNGVKTNIVLDAPVAVTPRAKLRSLEIHSDLHRDGKQGGTMYFAFTNGILFEKNPNGPMVHLHTNVVQQLFMILDGLIADGLVLFWCIHSDDTFFLNFGLPCKRDFSDEAFGRAIIVLTALGVYRGHISCPRITTETYELWHVNGCDQWLSYGAVLAAKRGLGPWAKEIFRLGANQEMLQVAA